MRFLKQNQVTHFTENVIYKHTMAPNLSYAWNFGSLAGLCLVIQILTGIFLAMHYTPETSLAFASIEHIMRDVQYGWLIRSLHANGASMFFLVVYAHMWRSMYYGSYGQPRVSVWMIGMVVYILMMATAFLGYILPWGQMSLWGATVITNLFSAVPFIGQELVVWLWGGYSVANPTLNRFFSLHYILPILIALGAFLHLTELHGEQSNNPLGITLSNNYPNILFHPYYVYKDLVGVCAFTALYIIFVFFYPNILGHSDNYIMANALVTPTHIVPEWYFLPFYAVLRSIPNKSMGIVAMASSIAVFFSLPYIHANQVRALHLTTHFRYIFWCFTFVWFGLIWIGSQPAVEPYIIIGRILTILYFLYFILIGALSSFSFKR